MAIDKTFEKDFLPIWCEQCNEQGLIFVDDMNQPHFVVCEKCGYETSSVWCEESGMGGEFVSNIGDRPKQWKCPDCKKLFDLPEDFYDNPIPLILESSLPPQVHEKVMPQRQPGSKFLKYIDWLGYPIFIFISWYSGYMGLYGFYQIIDDLLSLGGGGRHTILEGQEFYYGFGAILFFDFYMILRFYESKNNLDRSLADIGKKVFTGLSIFFLFLPLILWFLGGK